MTAGSQAVFPGTARNLLLSLGGVIQEPDTNFTISGSTLTFTTAPVANTTFFAVIFGDMQSTGTPSDGTVLPASIASSGNFSFPQLTVTGTSSLGDDVTFTGANYNVVWDKSDNCLEFTDNAKAKFGTGSDLEIYHDGSQSYITEGGTGDLYIQGSAIILEATNGENYFKGLANGAVQVYYDGVSKLQTTSTGIIVTAKTQIEGGSGDTELILKRTNTAGSNGNSFGTIKFNDENSNIIGRISSIRSTAADDGDITFSARPTGGSVTEYLRIKSTSHIQIPVDSARLEIGAGQDLKIAHTGSESYIQNSTGALQIQSDDIKLFDHSTAHLYFRGQTNSTVELYFDNSKKFETTSNGIAVQGTLIDFVGNGSNTTTLKVRNATHTDGTIYGHSTNSDRGFIQVTQSGADFGIQVGGANTSNMRFEAFGDSSTATRICHGTEEMITAAPNGAVELYHDNSKKFETISSGVKITGLNATGSSVLGDFRFKDQDDNLDVHYDAENNKIVFHDNNKATFGTGDDLQIYHDGTNSFITNTTGDFLFRNSAGNEIKIQAVSGEQSIVANANGSVDIYYDGSKKFETTSAGVQVTGALNVTTTMHIPDGAIGLQIGDSNDLRLFHDGSNSHIQEGGTGSLLIKSDVVNLGSVSGEYYFRGFENGAAFLRYDNSTKLETYSQGISLSGNCKFPDGSMSIYGASSDMEIYHIADNTNVIRGSGPLTIQSDDNVNFNTYSGGELMGKFIKNGAVELYYDNSKKFETTTWGNATTGGLHVAATSTVTGSYFHYKYGATGAGVDGQRHLTVTGNEAALEVLATDGGNHAGSLIIRGNNDGYAFINSADDNRLEIVSFAAANGDWHVHGSGHNVSRKDFCIVANQDGSVELYYDNVKKLNTSSGGIEIAGTVYFGQGHAVNVMNRESDGTLLEFKTTGTARGSISVSGNTVSYNGGHLSRWSQIKGLSSTDKSARPTIYKGTVMSNLDDLCVWKDKEPEQLNMTKISDTEGDKDVAGVFWAWDEDNTVEVNDFYVSMTGDMVIRVAASITVARGDLLISAGDGTAKPQADDIVRSSTIAKITSTTSTATYADGSKAYPCVLMAC